MYVVYAFNPPPVIAPGSKLIVPPLIVEYVLFDALPDSSSTEIKTVFIAEKLSGYGSGPIVPFWLEVNVISAKSPFNLYVLPSFTFSNSSSNSSNIALYSVWIFVYILSKSKNFLVSWKSVIPELPVLNLANSNWYFPALFLTISVWVKLG